MYPVLFELGGIKIYSYGLMIALGAIAGIVYMAIRGKKELKLTFDQVNSLFILIFIAAFVGGKVFLFFEDVSRYTSNPMQLLAGQGFVFYGSFLFAIPVTLWFFRKHKLPAYQMLDIMAITTCLVHMFGRIGCFMAGCCFGKPTDSFLGVTFTDPACSAEPLNTPLHAAQLYEAFYILMVLIVLIFLRSRKKFHGQLFLTYLMLYAIGRIILEYFRGDLARGFVINNYLSYAQFVALLVIAATLFFYVRLQKRT